MDKMRLEDFGYILSGLLIIVLSVVAIAAAVQAWPYVRGFTVALFHRYINAEAWQRLVTRVADLPAEPSVNRFQTDKPITSSVMDGAAVVPSGSSTGADKAVPPQQHQVAPASVLTFDDAISFLKRHKFESADELIDVLSVLQRDGKPLISANKIREIIGGNEAAVKARVATHRRQEPPPSARRLERPAEGW